MENVDIKKVHEELIDKKGIRKYFKLLNPKLEDSPFEVDIYILLPVINDIDLKNKLCLKLEIFLKKNL